MHLVGLLALSILAGACGNPTTGPVGPGGDGSGSAPDGKLPEGAPLVTAGERMQYRLSLRDFPLAAYTLSVGDVVDLDGKKAITVLGHAKLIGLAAFFTAKVDDRFTSWIDVQTGKSLRFQVDEFASNSDDMEHTVIDVAKREGDSIPIMFHTNDGAPTPEPQKVSQPVVWDYNAFLVLMRSWEGPPGTKYSLEVFRSRFLWNVSITIKGKTKLKTELGELPALQLDGHSYKIARDGSKFPADERDFTLWISDDAGRVPLRIDAKGDYGDVKMEITEYVAGNGEPLRR